MADAGCMRDGTVVVLLSAVLAPGCVFRKAAIAPPSEIRVAATPERIARGRYVFENLADCDGCHSQRDYGRLGGPVVAGGPRQRRDRSAGERDPRLHGGVESYAGPGDGTGAINRWREDPRYSRGHRTRRAGVVSDDALHQLPAHGR